MIDINFIDREYGLVPLNKPEYSRYSTQIKNFQLWYDNYGVHLEGSAPRFLNGHNIETLKYHQLPDFISSLSDAVGTDVSGLTLSRLDITDNIELAYPPRHYKKYFGNCRYFEKVLYQYNGIQYLNTVRSHTLYDKLIEMSDNKRQIPEQYAGKNLLRYEYSIKGRRKEHLKGINTLSDLTSQANYLTLIDRWQSMFDQIEKISHKTNVAMPYARGMKPRDHMQLFAAFNYGGIRETMENIDDWEDLGHFTRRQAITLKKNLNKFQRQYNRLSNAETVDPMDELLSKFKDKADNNRDMV